MFAEGRCRPAVSCPTYAAQLEELIPILSSKRQILTASARLTRTQGLELRRCSQDLLQAQRLHVLLFCLLWPRRSKQYGKDGFRLWAEPLNPSPHTLTSNVTQNLSLLNSPPHPGPPYTFFHLIRKCVPQFTGFTRTTGFTFSPFTNGN